MAGTDRTRVRVEGGPRVILVGPQLGENIGATARAMLNCGLTELVLVRPREPWLNRKAVAMSSGAEAVLERARVVDTIGAAVSDLTRVYAATARARDATQRILTPRRMALEMRAAAAGGERIGILFGPERAGLTNDDLLQADTLVTVPLNPAYASLNLAQAVLIVAYEWFQGGADTAPETLQMNASRPATKAELGYFLDRLEQALDSAGFFGVAEMRPTIVRNIRTTFQRAQPTDQEVRTLHGMLSSLIKPAAARAETPTGPQSRSKDSR